MIKDSKIGHIIWYPQSGFWTCYPNKHVRIAETRKKKKSQKW